MVGRRKSNFHRGNGGPETQWCRRKCHSVATASTSCTIVTTCISICIVGCDGCDVLCCARESVRRTVCAAPTCFLFFFDFVQLLGLTNRFSVSYDFSFIH